jgi:hypothetical protein
VALRDDLVQAEKLCFVGQRLRARESGGLGLTAVLDEGIQDDVRELLRSSEIECRELSQLDELALAIRGELGL